MPTHEASKRLRGDAINSFQAAKAYFCLYFFLLMFTAQSISQPVSPEYYNGIKSEQTFFGGTGGEKQHSRRFGRGRPQPVAPPGAKVIETEESGAEREREGRRETRVEEGMEHWRKRWMRRERLLHDGGSDERQGGG